MPDELVTIDSFLNPPLAYVARSRLEAEGIPCFLADEHTAQMYLGYAIAVGGIKLQVPASHAERAFEILHEEEVEPRQEEPLGTEEEEHDRCPACGSLNVEDRGYPLPVAVGGWLLLGLPFLFVPRRFCCRDCGETWKGF